ncbi:hypothetical protein I204_06910 [Kwoniella mangroviensis CBS 8886]|uniref:uncharacterized protein n=1 Tax=Kwoniella mangroviensis CBS 8507 TaxID=1296122 RepID=UPI00080CCE5E|nr:uncharacterized protein I203_01118 [Kwoniella mangroviensis CBS 8507]OCF69264.1 hypothetical protein I203_01118 [Kwoniella mangroviensis CBS 8507]OCF72528.1 hypothetical protein I204_06910 [Kwoniella mangroviensis CBS 8886]
MTDTSKGSTDINTGSWSMCFSVTKGCSLSEQGYTDNLPLELEGSSGKQGIGYDRYELFDGMFIRIGDIASFRYTQDGQPDIEGIVPIIERLEEASRRFSIGENEILVTMKPHPFDVQSSLPDYQPKGTILPFSIGVRDTRADDETTGTENAEEEEGSNCTIL